MKRKICRFFTHIKDFLFYDCKYGIQNLFLWFPVVWKNRDWDYYFIYTILRHKLHLTEKHIRQHDNHVNAQKDAKKIKTCVLLLDRIISDDYSTDALKNHDKKWGEGKMKLSPCKDDSELQKLEIIHKNVKTKEDEEKQRKDFVNASNHAVRQRNQDIEMLFSMMNKHIEGWWD